MNISSKNRCFLVTCMLVVFLLGALSIDCLCQTRAKTHIDIPDIPGYITMKCDFHMHTVFSDGSVWPQIRAEEAWRQGLDAFSITDHIEYQPHKDDVITNHYKPYEIARPAAEALQVLIIPGGEITRSEPIGHHNAIFLTDINALDTPDSTIAIRNAAEQGGFVFWNHPGWKQPDGKAVWFPIQSEIYDQGWLHGIEVVNGASYYPNAHAWCLEKKLTMMCSSDVHGPINLDYDIYNGQHRPMTLVFVKRKTENELKKALFDRRTAVYYNNILIGEEKYLEPLFNASVEILNPKIVIEGNSRVVVQISNTSDVSYELVADGETEGISIPNSLTLHAHKTVRCTIRRTSETLSGTKRIRMKYKVTNLLVAPEEGLSVELPLRITFVR